MAATESTSASSRLPQQNLQELWDKTSKANLAHLDAVIELITEEGFDVENGKVITAEEKEVIVREQERKRANPKAATVATPWNKKNVDGFEIPEPLVIAATTICSVLQEAEKLDLKYPELEARATALYQALEQLAGDLSDEIPAP